MTMSEPAQDHPDQTHPKDEDVAGSYSPIDRATAVTGAEQDDDAANEGQSTTSPAEGSDETAPPYPGSPQA